MVTASDEGVTPNFGEKKDYIPLDVLNFCTYCNGCKSNKSNAVDVSEIRQAALDSAKIYNDPLSMDKLLLDLAGVKSAEELKGKPPEVYFKAQTVFKETLCAVNEFITFCNDKCAYRTT